MPLINALWQRLMLTFLSGVRSLAQNTQTNHECTTFLALPLKSLSGWMWNFHWKFTKDSATKGINIISLSIDSICFHKQKVWYVKHSQQVVSIYSDVCPINRLSRHTLIGDVNDIKGISPGPQWEEVLLERVHRIFEITDPPLYLLPSNIHKHNCIL